jgi:glycosyltransferase involved in cell wall biosynthesis
MSNKIVYIIGGIWNGSGMERTLTMKANYMADEAGYEVHVLLTEDGNGPSYFPLSEKIHLHNVHVNFDVLYSLPIYKRIFTYLWKQRLYKRRLTDFLTQLKPDITISAMRREINFINDIPDGSKKVGEIHFTRIGYREVKLKFLPDFINHAISRLWIDKLLKEVKRLAAFVVLSEEDKLNWPELNNVQVIYNPLSINPEFSSDCCSKKVIAVGRYTYQKGFDLLAEAWKIVTTKYPDWELNIYGSGDAEKYRHLATEKGISETFICNGPVHDITAKYLESSIFVLSSRYEGFGLVIVEAMACGLPVVSFACPCGPRDIINNGEDGFLIENENINLLAEKIIYLIEHEEQRFKMGQNSIKSISRFKMENICLQWISLFESIKKK